jgi:hypothetical protein
MATFQNYNNHDMYVRDNETNAYTLSSDNKNLLGYIINYGKDHYVALRKLPDTKEFEYIDSLRSSDDIRPYMFTNDFLKYVKTIGQKIVSIRQVLNITESINPFDTLQDEYKKETKEDNKLGKIKRDITKLFANQYRDFIIKHSDYAKNLEYFFTILESVEDGENIQFKLYSNHTKNIDKLLKNEEYIQNLTAEIYKEKDANRQSNRDSRPLPDANMMFELLTTEKKFRLV